MLVNDYNNYINQLIRPDQQVQWASLMNISIVGNLVNDHVSVWPCFHLPQALPPASYVNCHFGYILGGSICGDHLYWGDE